MTETPAANGHRILITEEEIERMTTETPDEMDERLARVVQMPAHDGDGYGYGGDFLLVIDDLAVNFGPRDGDVAKQLARLWNAAANINEGGE